MSGEEDSISIKQKIEKDEGEGVSDVQLEKPEPFWMKIIAAESPNKQIPEYYTHPLNFDQSESTWRIIRGLEGIMGNLDRAIIDVVLGIVQKVFKSSKSKTVG